MKHWLITLCCGCGFSSALSAQQLSPAVLASNGGTNMAAGIQLEWTLGEAAIGSLSGQERNYTEGFHQPIVLLEKVDFTEAEVNLSTKDVPRSGITVSPNPVSTDLTIHFDGTTHELFDCQVLDANGNPHLHKSLRTNEGDVILDLSGLIPGLFFIRFIATDDGAITVFKLAKIK